MAKIDGVCTLLVGSFCNLPWSSSRLQIPFSESPAQKLVRLLIAISIRIQRFAWLKSLHIYKLRAILIESADNTLRNISQSLWDFFNYYTNSIENLRHRKHASLKIPCFHAFSGGSLVETKGEFKPWGIVNRSLTQNTIYQCPTETAVCLVALNAP